MIKQEILDDISERAGEFIRLRPVAALRDGMILTVPITIVGATFLLFANLPIPDYAEFMTGIFGDTLFRSLNSVGILKSESDIKKIPPLIFDFQVVNSANVAIPLQNKKSIYI